MVFKAASGILIAVVGAVTLFVVDSLTFGLALVSFAGITVPSADPSETASPERSPKAESGEGDAANEGETRDINDVTDTGRAMEADSEKRNAAPTSYLAELREGIAYVRGSLLVVLLAGVVVANFAAGAMWASCPPSPRRSVARAPTGS